MNDPASKPPFLGIDPTGWTFIFAGVVGVCAMLLGAAGAAVALLLLLAAMGQRKEYYDEKVKEYQAWLRSPTGIAYKAAEHEKQRKQQEEEECRRKEAERKRKEEEEATARAKWRMYHESKTMAEIDEMTGIQFEEFLARLFSKMAYTDISLTPANDQGGDVLCASPTGEGVVVQAKRWKGTVGNDAVQELLGAMLNYGRERGMVVTNSKFSKSARELARKDHRITLHDRRWLAEQVEKCFPRKIPEFNWEEYQRVVENVGHVKGARICPACHAPMRRVKSKFKKGRHFYGCSRYPACNGKVREPSVAQIELELQLKEQERVKRQAEEAVMRRQEADAARHAAEQRRNQEKQLYSHEGERLHREQERLKLQAEEAVRRRQKEAAERVDRDRKPEEPHREEAKRVRVVVGQKREQRVSNPERLREQFERLKREKVAEQARAAAEIAREQDELQKRSEQQELEERKQEQERQRQEAELLHQSLERLKRKSEAVKWKRLEEANRETINRDSKYQETPTEATFAVVIRGSSPTGEQATGTMPTGLKADQVKWIDRVVAFRAFDKRAKKLSMAECVRTVFLDQHEGPAAPALAELIARCARIVEKTINLRSSNPLGSTLSASGCLRQVWKEQTDEDADPQLVSMLIRSVWLAEDEKRMGGRYGDKPSAGCLGIGIHRDEIGPWQENAIRALEGD